MNEILIGQNDAALDTPALKAAVARLTLPTTTMDQGTLFLDGKFRVSEPLVISDDAHRPVLLRGMAHACLDYRGPLTDQPLLTICGQGRGACTRVEGMLLRCGGKCRGIRFDHAAYVQLARDCEVDDARQIAIDVDQCWHATLSGCKIEGVRGVALRWGPGSGAVRDMRINGRGEDWPADGTRAAVVISGHARLSHIDFEGGNWGVFPLLHTAGYVSTFEHIRVESTGNTDCLVVIEGDMSSPNSTTGKGRFCRLGDWHVGQDQPLRCLVELRGQTSGVEIDGWLYGGNVAAVVATDGGSHEYTVRRAETWKP